MKKHYLCPAIEKDTQIIDIRLQSRRNKATTDMFLRQVTPAKRPTSKKVYHGQTPKDSVGIQTDIRLLPLQEKLIECRRIFRNYKPSIRKPAGMEEDSGRSVTKLAKEFN